MSFDRKKRNIEQYFQADEKASFLPGSFPKPRPYEAEVPIPKTKKCCTKKCCCFTCLGCVLALILAAGGLFLYIQNLPDKSQDAAVWEAKLGGLNASVESFDVDGNYTLMSYDENYSSYLKSMGIPWYVVPLILASSETMAVKITDKEAEITTATDWVTRTQNFEFDQVFNMTYGKGMGTMWNVCTLEQPHIVICESEERERGWRLTSRMIFSPEGMVNERHFLNEDITAKKFYKRDDGEVDESEDKALTTTTTTTTTTEIPQQNDDGFSDSEGRKKGWDDWDEEW